MRVIPVIALIAIILLALYIPVRIPYSLRSIGKVYPHQEWRMMQDASGNIITTLLDNKTGVKQLLQAFQFERGDLVSMEFSLPDSTGGIIEKGDTLLKIRTILFQDRIQQLENQLIVEEANLKSQSTGDKPTVVLEAENRVHFAEEALKLQEKNYYTNKRLLEEGLISELDFRAFENAWQLAKINIGIEQKALESVQTGLKKEDVGIVRANIESLNNQIAFLKQQLLKYVIISPFKGHHVPVYLPEEMLVMYNTDEYILQIPIKAENIKFLSSLKKIVISDTKRNINYEAKLLDIGQSVEVVGGRQVVFIKASIIPGEGLSDISTGMAITCEIDCGLINQREYIRRVLNFSWD